MGSVPLTANTAATTTTATNAIVNAVFRACRSCGSRLRPDEQIAPGAIRLREQIGMPAHAN